MNESKTELWKSHPYIPGIEVSTFGRVKMLDRVTSSEKRTDFIKGRISKKYGNANGYLLVSIPVDGKWTMKRVHRLVAQTFISNPDNLPEVNHKNCIRDDNRVSNLEWCSSSYNAKYREKFGMSQEKVAGHPVLAVNLDTMKVTRFSSQHEASRALGFSQGNIGDVIMGRRKQTHGYWFLNSDDDSCELTNHEN